MIRYLCCDARRRDALQAHGTLNGIDFLEVSDRPSDPVADRQRTLFVHFLKDLAPGALGTGNVRVVGGERIRDPAVARVRLGVDGSPPNLAPDVMAVTVADAGDFSTYSLCLRADPQSDAPPAGFDPILSAVDFRFKVACDSDFDCARGADCPPAVAAAPEIDYLAKDYASFRRLMLDRMAVLAPVWRERNPADLGVTLVELLAYVGDRLSYQQDAVATEAYLGTARRRISVRRHARLVDHFMHDGSNARAWVQIRVRDGVGAVTLQREHAFGSPPVAPAQPTRFLTRVTDAATVIAHGEAPYHRALAARPEVFELLHDATLRPAHNELRFYTWGDEDCCLPKGATRATLRGTHPHLAAGDVLVFGEVRSPTTGRRADADPTRRHVVRLTHAAMASDPLGGRFDDPATDAPVAITEIVWGAADALSRPLCVSSRAGTARFDDVSVAWGNVVLVDHGGTLDEWEDLGTLPGPEPALTRVNPERAPRCDRRPPVPTPPRLRPVLRRRPLTHARPYTHPPASARAALVSEAPRDARPALELRETARKGTTERAWKPQRDLLSSGPDRRELVVETESDGRVTLRFGDDRFGARPTPFTRMQARYRIGNGVAGNIGAGSIAHLVSSDPAIASNGTLIERVWNPLPAAGGVEPETIDEARRDAPEAFRTQERAVTDADYAAAARRVDPQIQRAAATFRWTGSWSTVFVTADRLGGAAVDPGFEERLRAGLERFRMVGHDLEVDGPRFVSLEVAMGICLAPGFAAGEVEQALLEEFSNRDLPDGRRGVFHPDRFTFGQPVYLSPLYAAAQALDGVASVEITTFRCQGVPSRDGIDSGRLTFGRLEIPRLDNDPSFPERGVFEVTAEETA